MFSVETLHTDVPVRSRDILVAQEASKEAFRRVVEFLKEEGFSEEDYGFNDCYYVKDEELGLDTLRFRWFKKREA